MCTVLPTCSPVREEVALGPSLKAAYDAEGRPSRAAQGFARGQGVDVAALFTQETEKGVYVAARRTVGGASALDVLKDTVPSIIAALSFPKRMRWGEGGFAYARPMHWIVALLGGEVIPFRVGMVESGRMTCGHRVHGPGPFEVAHADDMDAVLAEKCRVTASDATRREIIIAGGNSLADKAGGRVLWNEALLGEVEGLAEHPVPLLGDFDPAFLELPREVLITSMETHQKSFGIESADGRLMPHFLTVLNLEPEDRAVVKKGWERVLRARLEDARFYWNTDLPCRIRSLDGSSGSRHIPWSSRLDGRQVPPPGTSVRLAGRAGGSQGEPEGPAARGGSRQGGPRGQGRPRIPDGGRI